MLADNRLHISGFPGTADYVRSDHSRQNVDLFCFVLHSNVVDVGKFNTENVAVLCNRCSYDASAVIALLPVFRCCVRRRVPVRR